MKSAYCLRANARRLSSPSLRAIRSAALVPRGRFTQRALVASVGAYRWYLGVPAYGCAPLDPYR